MPGGGGGEAMLTCFLKKEGGRTPKWTKEQILFSVACVFAVGLGTPTAVGGPYGSL